MATKVEAKKGYRKPKVVHLSDESAIAALDQLCEGGKPAKLVVSNLIRVARGQKAVAR